MSNLFDFPLRKLNTPQTPGTRKCCQDYTAKIPLRLNFANLKQVSFQNGLYKFEAKSEPNKPARLRLTNTPFFVSFASGTPVVTKTAEGHNGCTIEFPNSERDAFTIIIPLKDNTPSNPKAPAPRLPSSLKVNPFAQPPTPPCSVLCMHANCRQHCKLGSGCIGALTPCLRVHPTPKEREAPTSPQAPEPTGQPAPVSAPSNSTSPSTTKSTTKSHFENKGHNKEPSRNGKYCLKCARARRNAKNKTKAPSPDTDEPKPEKRPSPFGLHEYRLPKKVRDALDAQEPKESPAAARLKPLLAKVVSNVPELFSAIALHMVNPTSDKRDAPAVFFFSGPLEKKAAVHAVTLLSLLRWVGFNYTSTAICAKLPKQFPPNTTVQQAIASANFTEAIYGSPRLRLFLSRARYNTAQRKIEFCNDRIAFHQLKLKRDADRPAGDDGSPEDEDQEAFDWILNMPTDVSDSTSFLVDSNPANGDCFHKALDKLNSQHALDIDMSTIPTKPTSFNDIANFAPQLYGKIDFYNARAGAFFGPSSKRTASKPKMVFSENADKTGFHWMPARPTDEDQPAGSFVSAESAFEKIDKLIKRTTTVPANPELRSKSAQEESEILRGTATADLRISPISAALTALKFPQSSISVSGSNITTITSRDSISDIEGNFNKWAITKQVSALKLGHTADDRAIAIEVPRPALFQVTKALLSECKGPKSITNPQDWTTKTSHPDTGEEYLKDNSTNLAAYHYAIQDDTHSTHRITIDATIETLAREFGNNVTNREDVKLVNDIIKLSASVSTATITKSRELCSLLYKWSITKRSSDVVPALKALLRSLSNLPLDVSTNHLLDKQVTEISRSKANFGTVGNVLYPAIIVDDRPTKVEAFYIPLHAFLAINSPDLSDASKLAILSEIALQSFFSRMPIIVRKMFVGRSIFPLLDEATGNSDLGDAFGRAADADALLRIIDGVMDNFEKYKTYANWDGPANRKRRLSSKALLNEVDIKFGLTRIVFNWARGGNVQIKPNNLPITFALNMPKNPVYVPLNEKNNYAKEEIVESLIPHLPHPIRSIEYDVQSTFLNADNSECGRLKYSPASNMHAIDNIIPTPIFVNTMPTNVPELAPANSLTFEQADNADIPFCYALPIHATVDRYFNEAGGVETHEADVFSTFLDGVYNPTAAYNVLPEIDAQLDPKKADRALSEANRRISALSPDERGQVILQAIDTMTVNKFTAPSYGTASTCAPYTTVIGYENAFPFSADETSAYGTNTGKVDDAYIKTTAKSAYTTTFGHRYWLNDLFIDGQSVTPDTALPAHSTEFDVLVSAKLAKTTASSNEHSHFDKYSRLDWIEHIVALASTVIHDIDALLSASNLPLVDYLGISTRSLTLGAAHADTIRNQRLDIALHPEHPSTKIAADLSLNGCSTHFRFHQIEVPAGVLAQLMNHGSLISPRRTPVQVKVPDISREDLNMKDISEREQHTENRGDDQHERLIISDMSKHDAVAVHTSSPFSHAAFSIYAGDHRQRLAKRPIYYATAAERHLSQNDIALTPALGATHQYYQREPVTYTYVFIENTREMYYSTTNLSYVHSLSTNTVYATSSLKDDSTIYTTFTIGVRRVAAIFGGSRIAKSEK